MRLIIRLLGAMSVRALGVVLLLPLIRIALDPAAQPGGIWTIVLAVAGLLPPALWFLTGRVQRWIARPRWRSSAALIVATAALSLVLGLEIVGALQAADVLRLAMVMPLVIAVWAAFFVLCYAPGRYREILAGLPVKERPAKPARTAPEPEAPDPLDELLREAAAEPTVDEAEFDVRLDEDEPAGPAPPPLMRGARGEDRAYALAPNLRIRPEPKPARVEVPARVERTVSLIIILVIGFGIYSWAFAPFVPTAQMVDLVRWLSVGAAAVGAGLMLLRSWNTRPGVSRFHVANPVIRRPLGAAVGAALFWVLAFPIGTKGLPLIEAQMVDTPRTSVAARVVERGPGKQLLGCSYILIVTVAEPYHQDNHLICTGNSQLWSAAGPGRRIVLRGGQSPRGLHYTSVAGG